MEQSQEECQPFQQGQEIQKCQQTHSICGVGAHWQNGSVESYIGKLTATA